MILEKWEEARLVFREDEEAVLYTVESEMTSKIWVRELTRKVGTLDGWVEI